METLQIKKTDALKAFKEADAKGKTLLNNLFGEKTFSQKIVDRIKTFEDALAEIGCVSDSVATLLKYTGCDRDMISAQAFMKLTIIAKALNEDWQPDWSNSNEYKYVPYFTYKAGFGFSFTAYGHWSTDASVGSRLCFKSSDLALYAGTQFESIYNDYITF